jgi:hypothetical protein
VYSPLDCPFKGTQTDGSCRRACTACVSGSPREQAGVCDVHRVGHKAGVCAVQRLMHNAVCRGCSSAYPHGCGLRSWHRDSAVHRALSLAPHCTAVVPRVVFSPQGCCGDWQGLCTACNAACMMCILCVCRLSCPCNTGVNCIVGWMIAGICTCFCCRCCYCCCQKQGRMWVVWCSLGCRGLRDLPHEHLFALGGYD